MIVVIVSIAAGAICSASLSIQAVFYSNALDDKLFSDLIPKKVANISENKQPTCTATGAIPPLS